MGFPMMTLKLTFDERSRWHIFHEKNVFSDFECHFLKNLSDGFEILFQKMLAMAVSAAYQYVCHWIAPSIFGKFLKFRLSPDWNKANSYFYTFHSSPLSCNLSSPLGYFLDFTSSCLTLLSTHCSWISEHRRSSSVSFSPVPVLLVECEKIIRMMKRPW